MTTETYTLNDQTDFDFNHPVRVGTELTVEVVPGGVVSPASYEVIGAGPGATGVTVRYPTAPSDGTKTLKITRQAELQRLSDFTGAAGINATGLEKEFNNLYRALRDLVLRQTLKAPVKVATDANITLSGEQTVNGVSVTDGDRVLVTSQTDDTENGIYNVSTAAWTRTPDADDAEDVVNGTLVLDENSGNLYTFQLSGDFDPGNSSVTFTATDFDQILTDAQAARDKAEEWAENPEDDEVEPGEYSAYHWAQKAAENSDRAIAAQQVAGTDTLTASFGLTQYISTEVFAIAATNTNTGAVTLDLDSLGAKDVTLSDGSALPAGSIEANKVYHVWYDGAKFILLNPSVSQAVAEAGTQSEGVMTPLRTDEYTDARIAAQAQAEEGTNDTQLMTPLKTRQGIVTDSGSFTGTSAGLSTSETVTIYYEVIADTLVHIWVQGSVTGGAVLEGTSSDIDFYIGSVPSEITPNSFKSGGSFAPVEDNGSWYPGYVEMLTGGVIHIIKMEGTSAPDASFTPSGTKGIGSFSLTYSLR